jgi:hypothetical protein
MTAKAEPKDLDDILREADAGLISTETAKREIGGLSPLGVDPAVLADLRQPTPASEVKQRPTFRKVNGRRERGPDLSYVDARYVMDRLDDAVGPENWSTDQTVLPDGSVVTRITIRVRDGDTTVHVSKSDVGVPSTIEPVKGAFSDSFKRAAVHWGIGRDLYEDREDEMAEDPPARSGPIRGRAAAEDEDEPGDYQQPPQRNAPRNTGYRRSAPSGRPPAPGRALSDKQAAYDAFMETFDPEDSPWYCPQHNRVAVLQPGIGKQSGKPYGGKLICTERGCDFSGPWIEDVADHR